MKLYRIKKSNIDRRGRGLYAAKDIIAGTKIIDMLEILLQKNKLKILISLIMQSQFIYLI